MLRFDITGLVLEHTGTKRRFGGVGLPDIIEEGNMTMSTQLGYDPGNFYVWRASEGFAIHLSLTVVTQLNAQIARAGSDSEPWQPRGILLGRTIETPFRATVIEHFKLVPPSEGAEQPDADDALFEIACRMAEAETEQRVIGFFRARRDGRLNMSARDLQTFSRLFCEAGKVALLIQTSRRGNESDAALFYWQHGGAHPRDFGFGFPLEAGQLASGHPGWRYPDPLDDTQTPPPPAPLPAKRRAPAPPIPEPVSATGREGIRWSRLLPTAALVVIGISALEMATNSNRIVAAAPEPWAAVATPNEKALGLAVTSRPRQLEIRWNRESAAIAGCDRGVMKITEAAVTQAIPFDQRELRDGYLAYTPTTKDVSITLEVNGTDGSTTSESIRALAIP